MISIAFALLPSLVVENVERAQPMVSIQVIARVPRITARQADAMDAMVAAIPREVEGYSRRDVLTVTGGDPVRCEAGPDYVRISFHVPPENWKVGLSLMEALVRSSKLKASPTDGNRPSPSWTFALRHYAKGKGVRPGEAEQLYRNLFRPENLTLGIGGPIQTGVATEEWKSRMDRWTPPRAIPPNKYEPAPNPLTKNPGEVSTVEIEGPTFGASDAALPTKVLALMALGSGKGASLFRVARQKLGLSYRQEALLYPVPEGWESRLILETSERQDLEARGRELQKALKEDVAGWTDADLKRALGMAEAILTRGLELSPFALGPSGAVADDLEGRTFLRTYWQLKTGEPWNAETMLKSMRAVSLGDLKDAGQEVVANGKLRTLAAD